MLRTTLIVVLSLSVLSSIASAQTLQDYDVYILAGQSNADGRGEVSDLTSAQLQSLQSDVIISYLNPGGDRELTNPGSDIDAGTNGFQPLVPGGFSVARTSTRTLSDTFGPELSFAASIGPVTGSTNRVAIIKVSRGGTDLRNDWLVNAEVNTSQSESEGFLYRALIEQVGDSLETLRATQGVGEVNVVGFLWHQGESDSNSVSAYTARFTDLVNSVRDEFGEDIPLAVGELSRDRVDEDGVNGSVNFNNNLTTLASSVTGVSIVSSLGLETPRTLNPTDFTTDGTHFNANGQVELGQRFAQAFAVAPAAGRSILFDFRTTEGAGVAGADPAGTNFDPGTAGNIVTVDGLTATIVDVTAPEYDLSGAVPVATGNILSSAEGDLVNTNVSGQDALGINNPSIGNEDFDIIGNGNDSADLNPEETLTFSFDQAVQFTAIELESVEAADSFDVLVDGVAVLETTGDDGFIEDLGGLAGLTIAAGAEITFAVDGVLETNTGGPATSIRIETFTVETVATSPIILGDVNLDGAVDFLDISPFIVALSSGLFQAEADVDESGEVDFLDISPFIVILSGS